MLPAAKYNVLEIAVPEPSSDFNTTELAASADIIMPVTTMLLRATAANSSADAVSSAIARYIIINYNDIVYSLFYGVCDTASSRMSSKARLGVWG